MSHTPAHQKPGNDTSNPTRIKTVRLLVPHAWE